MARRVGVELSASRCALVDLDVPGPFHGAGSPRVRAFRVISWNPADPGSLTAALRRLRASKAVGRRAAVVMWGVAGDDGRVAPSVTGMMTDRLAPLAAAGLSVDAVVSPAAALAALCRLLHGTDQTPHACVAVNGDATAIAIVRNDVLLFGREIPLLAGRLGPVEDASLAAIDFVRRLAPELKRAFLWVRQHSRLDVRHLVLCGDVPNLRALTAPLMQALNVEVETLDTPQGLAPGAAATDIREHAGELRVAWAAAAGRCEPNLLPDAPVTTRRPRIRLRPVEVVTAAVALLVIVWLAFGRQGLRPADGGSRAREEGKAAPAVSRANRPAEDVKRMEPVPAAARREPAAAPGTFGREANPERAQKRSAAPRRPDDAPAAGADPTGAPLVRDPVIQSILYAPDRRLALIDRRIVHVGDRIDAGVVADIEPNAVVIRRSSGELRRVEMIRPAGAVPRGVSRSE